MIRPPSMLRSKRAWAGVVVVLGLLVVGYFAWLGLTVHGELHAAQHDAGKLKTALAKFNKGKQKLKIKLPGNHNVKTATKHFTIKVK